MKKLAAVAAVAVLTTLVVAPGTLLASHRFEDVPDGNPFHDEIDALADRGITQGCDTQGTRYCPGDALTRQQMAGFLYRILGIEGEDPVVNATSVDGRDSRDLAWTTGVPVQVLHRIEHFDVQNAENDGVECAASRSDFEAGSNTPGGAYTVTYQLFNAPAPIPTWAINVQIANLSAGDFDVCLATIDGRELPDGRYSAHRQEMVTIGVS